MGYELRIVVKIQKELLTAQAKGCVEDAVCIQVPKDEAEVAGELLGLSQELFQRPAAFNIGDFELQDLVAR